MGEKRVSLMRSSEDVVRIPRPIPLRVLLVEADSRERDRLGRALEEAGFEVLQCPGPGGPDYVCVGGRGERCPLAEAADVIVLDLWLRSDTIMTGTPGWELLSFYGSMAKPVVALSAPGDPFTPMGEGSVAVLRRPPELTELIAAVVRLASGSADPIRVIETSETAPRRKDQPAEAARPADIRAPASGHLAG
jgi:DNA-binding response OmpR family regulator